MKRTDRRDKGCQLLFGSVKELSINFSRESRAVYSQQSSWLADHVYPHHAQNIRMAVFEKPQKPQNSAWIFLQG